jgi:hypothetical protein
MPVRSHGLVLFPSSSHIAYFDIAYLSSFERFINIYLRKLNPLVSTTKEYDFQEPNDHLNMSFMFTIKDETTYNLNNQIPYLKKNKSPYFYKNLQIIFLLDPLLL